MEITIKDAPGFFSRLGSPVLQHLRVARTAFILFKSVVFQIFTGPWRVRETLEQTVQIGTQSLPIVTIATLFAGLVVTQEVAWHMNQALHTVQMLPGFTGQFILRELGVAIPALLVIAKVGAAIAAETASMRISEQLEALQLLRINPVHYLVFPRWLASIFSVVSLTLISIAITLIAALLMAVYYYNFNALEYLNALGKFLKPGDLLCATVKSAVFGAMIPIVSCAYGFHSEGGAQGVGAATTHAVVGATLCLIVLDFILTYVFSLIL